MKRLLGVFIAIIMVVTTFAPLSLEIITADISITANASGVDNIVARAYYMYNSTWVCRRQVSGWKYTFQDGQTYHIPYGQPATAGKFIGFGVDVETFVNATTDPNSIFYTEQSYWEGTGTKSTYYASDCSAFVSYCWDVSRTTTSNWKNLNVTNLGSASSASNLNNLQPGDALNHSGDHIVLITAVNEDGTFDIMQQTPPQLRVNKYSKSDIIQNYGNYTIYRYNNRDSVPPPPTGPDPSLPCDIDISGFQNPSEGYIHTPGNNCGLYGTITSNHNLKRVWGGVYNLDGTPASGSSTTCSDSAGSTSYSLRGTFNNSIIFDDIPKGSYYFSISAEDADGYVEEVIHHNFSVGEPMPSAYTVSLNANGGSVSTTSITVSANGTYSGLPTPSRTGYDFSGWFTSASGGTQKSHGSGLASNSDHTLYAHWRAKKFTVSFNANGGSVSPTSKTVTYDSTYGDLPTPSKTGYSFQGWFTAASGGTQISSGTKVNITSNQTLYAHWNTGNLYTVSFDGNGGTASSGSKEVTYGGTYGELPSGSKTGYTMNGWFTAKSGGTQVTSGTKVSTASDHTLYAQWTANQYNITLIYNDGTDKSETVKVTYDSAFGLKDPEREGYFFNGWFTAATGGTQIATSAKVAVTSDQTLYAHWSKDQLMLTFNPMGGKTDVTSKLLTYDNRYGILPEAERTGYTFEGWYLDEAYTQPITETDVVKATGNQTAYAKWSIRQYIVTFDAGEGTPDVDNKKVAFGKAYGALPDATWSDREFLGWYTDDDTEITSESIVELENDTVLYAKWRLMGDVNVDGVFDIQDIIMVQDWLLAKPDATLTDWRAADTCQDERIDVFDLCLLKRWLIERNGDMQ